MFSIQDLANDIKRKYPGDIKDFGESIGLVTEVMCVNGVCKEIAYIIKHEDGKGPVSKKLKKEIKPRKRSRKRSRKSSRKRKKSRKRSRKNSRKRTRAPKRGGSFAKATGRVQLGNIADGDGNSNGIKARSQFTSGYDMPFQYETQRRQKLNQLKRSISNSKLRRMLSPKARRLSRTFDRAEKELNRRLAMSKKYD